MKTVSRLSAMLVGFVVAQAVAIDLGVVGQIYPIAEPDAIQEIQQILAEKQRNGELEKLQEDWKKKVEKNIQNPTPVPGLSRVTAARTYYYDPSIRIEDSIVDTKGNVIVPAGTVKNPLDVVALPAQMLFIDARDTAQLAFAKRTVDSLNGRVRLILVGGSPIDLMQKWQMPVYFDQRGTLVKKFGIGAVPAIVSQEGKMLRIDELKV